MAKNKPSFTDSKPTASTPAAIQPQDSPLLKLPAEIKNEIFELVHPSGTTIRPSARVNQSGNGSTIYSFYPSSPPLHAVCRQLRAEFPIARYYSQNTLSVGPIMLHHPYALRAFITARMPAIDHVQSCFVMHWCKVLTTPIATSGYLRGDSDFDIRFKASTSSEGLRLDEIVSESSGSRPQQLCCCTLRGLVEDANDMQGEGRKTLAAVLSAYGEAVGNYRAKMRTIIQADEVKVCSRCRKVKGF